MMNTDIIRFYLTGMVKVWKDDKIIKYRHYLGGSATTCFKYVKELYHLL